MSPAMTGAWIGAAFGFVSFVVLRFVASKIEQGGLSQGDPKKAASVIRLAAFVDLLLFPVVGYFLGPMVITA